MTFQMGTDRVNRGRFIAAILDMFKVHLGNGQGEGESEEPVIEEIFPTATMMILLLITELAKDFFIGEPRAWHDSSGNRQRGKEDKR